MTADSDLRAGLRELARPLRELALDLDRDPELIRDHLDLPAVRFLATMGIPAEHGNDPARIPGLRCTGATAAERVVVMEEFACADAGMLVASPGPLLAGTFVDAFGDEAQRQRCYQRMLAEPTWTFFALTEPDTGSAAGEIRTGAKDGRITGEKRYVGNACRAQLGVLFARTAPGPLGVTALLLEPPVAGFVAEPLPMLGLRGARISSITLDDVPYAEEDLLGRHLSKSRRGVAAFVRTFNRLRPGVAAIGLGIARSACAYIADNRRCLNSAEQHQLDLLRARIRAARRLVATAAAAVDADAADGALASAAKAHTSALALSATRSACGFFGAGARFEHPLLDKWIRDAKSLEFIEGTTHMQYLNVAQGIGRGSLGTSAARPTVEER